MAPIFQLLLLLQNMHLIILEKDFTHAYYKRFVMLNANFGTMILVRQEACMIGLHS